MNTFSTIPQAIQAIKDGKIIILVDDLHRENEGDFVCSAQHINASLVNHMITEGKGLVCVPISVEKAIQLGLEPMVKENTDTYRTAFTISVDALNSTTGISASERALTIKLISDHQSTPKDFKKPGHIFPLIGKPGGVLERPGHTEASLELMKLAGLKPAAVICEILKTDGTMARRNDLLLYAKKHAMVIVEIAQLIHYIKEHHHA
jgi:3,4-dihydroxy 2-butanone 4-phosphate synthase/GTP cyclohydrolase II